MTPTFIIGTGRCGSQMIAGMLRRHSRVLVLDEFLNIMCSAMRVYEVSREPVDGKALSAALTQRGLFMDELIIEEGESGPRQTDESLILRKTLAPVSPDPAALLDRLVADVVTWPVRPVADQCRRMFDLLADILDCHSVVERSGSSVNLLPSLVESFPVAKFMHICRDGLDSGLSMSRHAGFRLEAIQSHLDEIDGRAPSANPSEMQLRISSKQDSILNPPYRAERIRAFPIPIDVFGGIWSDMVATAVTELGRLDGDRWIAVQFESVLTEPVRNMSRMAEFLGIAADRVWLEEVSAMVDPSRIGTAGRELAHEELAELRLACRKGVDVLASQAFATS